MLEIDGLVALLPETDLGPEKNRVEDVKIDPVVAAIDHTFNAALTSKRDNCSSRNKCAKKGIVEKERKSLYKKDKQPHTQNIAKNIYTKLRKKKAKRKLIF